MIKICEYCEEEFETKRKSKRFCNAQCSNNRGITRIEKQCLYCDLKFNTTPSQIKNGGGK